MKRAAQWWLLMLVAAGGWNCTAGPSEKLRWDKPYIETGAMASTVQREEVLPQLHDQSGLSDYLTYAALNNPGLKAAFLRWRAALEKIPQVTALPDPRFTYGYYIQSVETRVGPQNNRFGLLQTFPWFGKLELQGGAAAEAARSEKERYEAAKLKLFYQVKEAYFEYYYLARAILVTEENLGLMQQLESVARTQYAAGFTPYSNVMRAQVELGKLEDRVKTLEDLREPIVAKLNAALNRPADAPLPWPREVHEEAVKVDQEQLMAWLRENNPDLKAVGFLAEKEKKNIDLARKNFFPDITLGVEAIDTGQALNPATTPDSGKDAVVASLSLNLPIWWEKYSAGEREALARYEAFMGERSDQENRLAADLKLAVYKYRDAERKINLYRDTLIPKAVQSVEVSLQTFETGLGSFLDLIDSIRTLLEFQLAFERAFADQVQRLAEIEMIVARELPRTTDGEQENNAGSRVGEYQQQQESE
ncbi:TolC family protein [Desulfoferrobacter suflitae]|uniref:TolC family protein n=1 Tax=Desulfoferrobacter suflitae TaxID=2865782 RepID=UPI0021642FF2|nr:TolC family protein [Desulfoferrobacter suflitae]MCK8602859.1 TolC family protein [Desulfoferrobacter suflitae]